MWCPVHTKLNPHFIFSYKKNFCNKKKSFIKLWFCKSTKLSIYNLFFSFPKKGKVLMHLTIPWERFQIRSNQLVYSVYETSIWEEKLL